MQCAACGSQRLSPPAQLRTNQGTIDLFWKIAGKTGWFGGSGVVCRARVGMVCGDCDYFMLFADAASLADARQSWAELQTPDP